MLQNNDVQKAVILDAKKRVASVIQYIETLQKKLGKTKESKQALLVMRKFLNCHLNNDAIFKRYQEVMILMERYAHAVKS